MREAYRFWCTTFNAQRVGLDRRRGLPDADRPGAPQARGVPRRRAGPVPHELPGRRDRRRVPQLALPRRPRRRDRDGTRAAIRSRPRSSCTSSARKGSPTSTRSACAASTTTPPGHRARSTRTSSARSTCGSARGPHRPPSPSAAAACRSAHREPGAPMIYVSHALPVNEPDQPQSPATTCGAVWSCQSEQRAAVRTQHDVLRGRSTRHSDTVFDREHRVPWAAIHRADHARGTAPSRVHAHRRARAGHDRQRDRGSGRQISRLRFSFALVVAGVEGGSAGEQEYADSMTGDYLKAVEATLNAMRRVAADNASA